MRPIFIEGTSVAKLYDSTKAALTQLTSKSGLASRTQFSPMRYDPDKNCVLTRNPLIITKRRWDNWTSIQKEEQTCLSQVLGVKPQEHNEISDILGERQIRLVDLDKDDQSTLKSISDDEVKSP